MKFSKILLASLAFSSLTALASEAHYRDNKGHLYCEVTCKVDGTIHKAGLYPKNDRGNTLKVRGQWTKTGLLMATTGRYEVASQVHENAKKRCQDIKENLFAIEKIRDLIDSSDVSGVSKSSCKITPKITSDAGLLTFDMVLVEDEDEKTDL
jgi:hypothetical protein